MKIWIGPSMEMTMDSNVELALHAFAMMFVWVPFVVVQGALDIMEERRARAGVPRSRVRHHWYTPLVHPLRSRTLAHQH